MLRRYLPLLVGRGLSLYWRAMKRVLTCTNAKRYQKNACKCSRVLTDVNPQFAQLLILNDFRMDNIC